MRGTDRGICDRQIGRIGYGVGLQRHHTTGTERESSSAAQQSNGCPGPGRHPKSDHVVRAAVVAVRGRTPVDRTTGRWKVHDNGVGVHDGQAPGPPPVELHGALDHGRGSAGRAVVSGVRQHRFKVPQGRRGDHGVHVGGWRRGRNRNWRRRRPGRLVVRGAGRQKLRVPVVGHFHGHRVHVRVAGVQDCVPGVQQQEADWPLERRPNAPVLFASAVARQRCQSA